MKYLAILLGLILFTAPLVAQDIGGGNWRANKAQLFKTYTNYTATSDDTSSYITIDPPMSSDVMMASEVTLILVSTDSIAADINVLGINGHLTSVLATTHTDSIVASDSLAAGMNSGSVKIVVIKDPVVSVLDGATQIRVGTVFRATGQGTTAGRTAKWYIKWRK